MKKRCRRSADAATTCTPPTPRSLPPSIRVQRASICVLELFAGEHRRVPRPRGYAARTIAEPSTALARLVVTNMFDHGGFIVHSFDQSSCGPPRRRLRTHHRPTTWDPYFMGYMTLAAVSRYPTLHLEHHCRQLTDGAPE